MTSFRSKRGATSYSRCTTRRWRSFSARLLGELSMGRMAGLSLEEFLGLEETKPASEYACGEAFQKPMPNQDHSALQLFVGVMLFNFLSGSKLGKAFTEFRCIFGSPGRERTYVP